MLDDIHPLKAQQDKREEQDVHELYCQEQDPEGGPFFKTFQCQAGGVVTNKHTNTYLLM